MVFIVLCNPLTCNLYIFYKHNGRLTPKLKFNFPNNSGFVDSPQKFCRYSIPAFCCILSLSYTIGERDVLNLWRRNFTFKF